MARDSRNVSAAEPKIGGAISVAPLGTSLPETANANLAAAFVKLGYVSEDGLTNSNPIESEQIGSWDGETVLTVENSRTDSFRFKLLEVLNVNVLKAIYGSDNVEGTLESGITVKANSKPKEEMSWVVDMVMKNGVLKRIVIPQAKLSGLEDIVYKRNEAVGYDATITATPYEDYGGDTHRELIIKASESLG